MQLMRWGKGEVFWFENIRDTHDKTNHLVWLAVLGFSMLQCCSAWNPLNINRLPWDYQLEPESLVASTRKVVSKHPIFLGAKMGVTKALQKLNRRGENSGHIYLQLASKIPHSFSSVAIFDVFTCGSWLWSKPSHRLCFFRRGQHKCHDFGVALFFPRWNCWDPPPMGFNVCWLFSFAGVVEDAWIRKGVCWVSPADLQTTTNRYDMMMWWMWYIFNIFILNVT